MSSIKSIPAVHVAVGVISDGAGQVLIALRGAAQHQGGRWEFPGGKVEPGESVQQALTRELKEELGFDVKSSKPLIQIAHTYSDKSVVLDVWHVTEYEGEPFGREGQEIQWVAKEQLLEYNFPDANRPIITAIQLSDCALITGDAADMQEFSARIERGISRGAGIVQLRSSGVRLNRLDMLKVATSLCRKAGVRLLVNSSWQLNSYSKEVGLHLTASDLLALRVRPVPDDVLLGASCHSEQELAHAKSLGVDYIYLSAVAKTDTHPEVEPLGWDKFKSLTAGAVMPVYALGGVGIKDLERSKESGAQGIAAISGLWLE